MLDFDVTLEGLGGLFEPFLYALPNNLFMLFFRVSPVYDARMFIAAGSKIQPMTILLILVLGCALVVSAFRISKMASHYGRRRWVWFFISLFFTAIPATIVFWRDYTRSVSARESLPALGCRLKKTRSTRSENPPERCPHCGEILLPVSEKKLENENNGYKKCPNCKMKLDMEHFA